MNKRILFCLLLISMTGIHLLQAVCNDKSSCRCDETGHTFLFVRPLFQSNMPEMVTGFRDELFHAKHEGWGAFQGVIFGSRSYDTEEIQRYFTPFCKTSLLVDETLAASQATAVQGGLYTPERDLYTQHFNVLTKNSNFRSRIEFKPHQSVVGFGMHYRKDFWRDEANNRACYFSASSPLTSVRNTFKIKEEILNDGGGVSTAKSPSAVANMTEAFRQKDWNYGKIASSGSGRQCAFSEMRKTKLADIELKLGIEWLERHPCHFESYVGVLIPTGNKPKGEYIFEPIVGWGGHTGIMFGGYAGVNIWQDEACGRDLRIEYSLHSQYLFSNHQTRSIDLKYKPFSRYAQVYTSKAQATQAAQLGSQALNPLTFGYAANVATPGINVFTRELKVTPGYMYNINTAVVFDCEQGWQLEGGYNLFFRREDCVKLACPFPTGIALKHVQGNGLTNPVRDITGFFLLEDPSDDFAFQHALTNYDYNTITEDDLDLNSAAQPAILTHTFYGYLGYRWLEKECPFSLGFGGSVEFSKANNAGLERWVMWGKAGFAF